LPEYVYNTYRYPQQYGDQAEDSEDFH
jgi:hypothetical protein